MQVKDALTAYHIILSAQLRLGIKHSLREGEVENAILGTGYGMLGMLTILKMLRTFMAVMWKPSREIELRT